MRRKKREIRKAVALRYAWDLPAPILIASGRGGTAEKIRGIAASCGIPVVSDPGLTDALIEIDPGSFIPEEVYAAVAAILAFVVGLEDGGGYGPAVNGSRGADGKMRR
jgi:flagellar biosynthesis protein